MSGMTSDLFQVLNSHWWLVALVLDSAAEARDREQQRPARRVGTKRRHVTAERSSQSRNRWFRDSQGGLGGAGRPKGRGSRWALRTVSLHSQVEDVTGAEEETEDPSPA